MFKAFLSFGQAEDEIIGKWLVGQKDGAVLIYKNNNKYYGKLVWLKEPLGKDGKPIKDLYNSSAAQQNRAVMGLVILEKFEFLKSEGEWSNGTIYDPHNGKTYSCKITKVSKNEIEVRGYIGISLLGRSEVWKRIE